MHRIDIRPENMTVEMLLLLREIARQIMNYSTTNALGRHFSIANDISVVTFQHYLYIICDSRMHNP